MMTQENTSIIREVIADDELLSSINVEIDEITDETLSLHVPYSSLIALAETTPGMGNTVHAGIIATMIDMAGEVLRLEADDPESFVLATTDLHVTYLRPATDDLYVKAEVTRVGTSMAVSEVSVSSDAPDGRRKEVAVGRGSYRVLREGS